MKSTLRLIYRKIQSHVPQLLGLMLLLVIGVGFFITLSGIALRSEEVAEQYFIEQAYADVTFYGTFNDENVRAISELDGIILAQGRTVQDFREGEQIFRIISLTDGINIPFIYDGRTPLNETEGLILKSNAYAMGIAIGDTLNIRDRYVVITGLVTSPEYVYMVQNERITMARPDSFGVVFVRSGFFTQGYDEIVALTYGDFCNDEASNVIAAFRTVTREAQTNYVFLQDDIGVLRTFAFIFPFVFAILIAAVIYVMLSRSIQKDRKQIGTMKAMGVSNTKIIGIYLSQFCFTALVGALLGGAVSIFIGDVILDVFLFELPALSFVIYSHLWLSAILVSVLMCALSGLIALLSILALLPANAMRPRQPKGKKRTLLENVGFLWNRFSFNTRYALKSSLRNKGRFLAVVLGMCGTTILLTFSLGFNDSIINTQDRYFDDFANYDVIINLDIYPLAFEHPVLEQIDESRRTLIMPVNIQGEYYTLIITENEFDMFNVDSFALQNGIVIPDFFADRWNVETGDSIGMGDYYVTVSAVIPQYLGLMLLTSFEYVSEAIYDIPEVYNTIFGRNRDMEALALYLVDNDIDFTTIYDDKTSFDSVMGMMSMLIWVLIAFSIILGFTVLYSVGMINLSAREYEYMFMGVMGYPQRSILMAHIKETIGQLALAIPLGFLLGYLLLENIRGAFSSDNFVISAVIFPRSYFISALSVIGVTVILALVTSRHIEKLDVVEGLKSHDD